MTDRERKLKRAEWFVDVQDATDELAQARNEAVSAARAHESVAGTLRHNADLEPSSRDFTADGDIANRLTPDQLAQCEGALSAAKLIGEMKKASQRVFNLYQSKANLPAA